MHRLAITAMLCLLTAGCSVDQLVLNEAEQQDLVDNFDAAVRVYSDLSEFAFAAALGNGDVEDYDYEAPSAANGWVGTILWPGAVFPSGTGNLTMRFSVSTGGVPVDPYSIDLSAASSASIDAEILFDGTSDVGAPLHADADLTIDMLWQDGESASTVMNGNFIIQHNAYVADLVARDFTLLFDLATQQSATASGDVIGKIDIPNFAFDADFSLTGLGSQIAAVLRVAGTRVNYFLDVADL